MTIIGFIFIIVALVLAILINVYRITPVEGAAEVPPSFMQKMLNPWTARRSVLLGLVGVAFIAVSGLFFYNPAGTATAIQYLWGGDAAVTTQGVKLKFWGKTIPISFEIALQDMVKEFDQEGKKVFQYRTEEGIYHRSAQTREFADAIKADIAAALIVSINYNNEELFLEMADKNRSESKLVYARIYPVYDQALKNTCKLMDAQDYISGASSQFDYYLKDQMENGMYLTEEVYEEIDVSPISTLDSARTVAKGKIMNNEKREKRYRIRKDENGEPIRDASNSLQRYGLTVQQVAVTSIDWEASFDNRLKDQKEQVAQTQLEKQEAEKEYYATQKAIAKGEREKAETRVKLEKVQLEQTITAETAAKTASYKEQEETNLLAAARKSAQKIRVIADAEAYEISKKVSAGITPEKRLQMELDASVQRTEALA
ncbi:SPFH domain-containing protein, partial [Lutimonas sp.]|uniref:SPFH domain-containing protein n=1 Tax=Lutimonas sp. TaxID=1872403 RepID=UPI003D9B7D9D